MIRGIDFFVDDHKITLEYIDDEFVKFVNTNIICQSISEEEVDDFLDSLNIWQ